MKRNKTTRKMLAGILAAGLIASAAVPVYATETGTAGGTTTGTENTNGNTNGSAKTQEMTVGYTEGSTFTLRIPSSVTLKENEEVSETVGLEAINVGTKEKVQIKVKSGISGGKVTLEDEKDSTNIRTSVVALTSNATEGIAENAVVAEFEGTSTEPTTGGTLYFAELGDVPAGTYKGTIMFEASVVSENL